MDNPNNSWVQYLASVLGATFCICLLLLLIVIWVLILGNWLVNLKQRRQGKKFAKQIERYRNDFN